MSRSSLLVCAALVAAAAACDRAPAGPVAPVTPEFAYTSNFKHQPVDYNIWRCTEMVHVVGTAQYMFVLGDSLDTTHRTLFRTHFRETGTAVGLTTGSRYRYSEAYSNTVKLDWDLGSTPPWTVTNHFKTRMISLDTMPDFIARSRFHVTVNARGDTAVWRDQYESDCNR